MNKTHLTRWQNAVRIAERLNKYMDDGYIVLDEHGELQTRFDITENSITQQTSPNSTRVTVALEDGWDSLLYDTIAEYNKRYTGWTIAKKEPIKNLFKKD